MFKWLKLKKDNTFTLELVNDHDNSLWAIRKNINNGLYKYLDLEDYQNLVKLPWPAEYDEHGLRWLKQEWNATSTTSKDLKLTTDIFEKVVKIFNKKPVKQEFKVVWSVECK